MHAFPLYVFQENFKSPHPTTEAEFIARFPWASDHAGFIKIRKPRFKVGDRVTIRVGRVPEKHNTGYTLDEGVAVVKAIDVLENGITVSALSTRVMYKIEFERPVGWIDIDTDWNATEVVVQESSLMVRA